MDVYLLVSILSLASRVALNVEVFILRISLPMSLEVKRLLPSSFRQAAQGQWV